MKFPKWPGIFVILMFIYSAIVCYWLFYPYKPIIVEQPILIINPNKQVLPNDFLIYKITYDKKMDLNGVLTRKLVNTFKIEYTDVIVTAPIGIDTDQLKLPVPHYAPPGKYYLWWSVSYKVNPLRTVTVCAKSEEFEVILDPKENLKGDTGKTGPIGKTGPPGEDGDKGDTGKTGPIGKTGEKGSGFWGGK